MMNRKIVISAFTIFAVAAAVVGATTAFFSDTETSTGNTFAAGAIDLTIDNKSYYLQNDDQLGTMIPSGNTTWGLKDLGSELFFDFHDLKPGDIGEDTISIHVDNNDAWACMAIQMTENSDNTCTEPELTDDEHCAENVNDNGELADELRIAVWADDGDNVFEVGERLLNLGGNSQIVTIKELTELHEVSGPPGVLTLADSGYNLWHGTGPIKGDDNYYIGKAWCFGDIAPEPLAQESSGGPNVRGPGVSCTGASVISNASQTDVVKGDIQFYAVQSRNNPGFKCGQDYSPSWK